MSSAPLKSYDLEQSAPAGDTNPLNTRYKVNGQRVSQARFNEVRAAAVRQDTFNTVNRAGVVHHYSVAYTSYDFFPSAK